MESALKLEAELHPILQNELVGPHLFDYFSFNDVIMESESVLDNEVHPALQNELVMEHVFSVLSLSDIKSCRLVHKVWRDVGAKVLRRRSKVVFDFAKGKCLETKNNMLAFSTLCKERPPENSPYSSFSFEGRISIPSLLNSMIDINSYMKELEINCWGVVSEVGKMIFDVNPIISRHLTKLHIHLSYYTHIRMSLSFDEIPFVKDIDLNRCVLSLRKVKNRIAPNKIALGFANTFTKDGEQVEFLVLNEFFDLKFTQNICLSAKNVILDFSDCANDKIERIVSLTNAKIRNWEMCNWKIKTLTLDGVSFLACNFITMQQLETKNADIDLLMLHDSLSLQKLCFGEFTTIVNPFFSFPNLIDLVLTRENYNLLSRFSRNNSIVNLDLGWSCQQSALDEILMDLNDLPIGIRKLTLRNIFGIEGDFVYPLQTLYLEEYRPFLKCLHISSKFQYNTLIISYSVILKEYLGDVINLLNKNDSHVRLVIGNFIWTEANPFSKSEIKNFVDKEAECYVFEGKNGRALAEGEEYRYLH